MEIRFSPQEPKTGCVAFASWESLHLHDALRRAFNEGPRERLVMIDVTRDGLRAYFEPHNVAVTYSERG